MKYIVVRNRNRDLANFLNVTKNEYHPTLDVNQFLDSWTSLNPYGILAIDKNRIVGIFLASLHHDFNYLIAIEILPDYRHHLISIRMLQKAWADEKSFSQKLSYACTWDSNSTSKFFFSKLGGIKIENLKLISKLNKIESRTELRDNTIWFEFAPKKLKLLPFFKVINHNIA